jgi:hypothetical protein
MAAFAAMTREGRGESAAGLGFCGVRFWIASLALRALAMTVFVRAVRKCTI